MAGDKLTFSGFEFDNMDAMVAAKKEAAAVAHINSKLNTQDINAVYAMYLKLVDKQLFSTVIGEKYLKDMRETIISSGLYEASKLPYHDGSMPYVIEKEDDLNLDFFQEELDAASELPKPKKHDGLGFTKDREKKPKKKRNGQSSGKRRKKRAEEGVYTVSFKKPFIASLIVIAALVVIMIVGYRTLTNSNNINILNYKERLEKQYEDRENELAERERQLNEQIKNIHNPD